MIVTKLTRKIFVNMSTEKIHLQNVQDVAYMTYDVNLYSIKLDLLGPFFGLSPVLCIYVLLGCAVKYM
jgi:hypothetical protein